MPAVVGIVIIFGKGLSLLILGGVSSNSKSLNGTSLFAVRHMSLPPVSYTHLTLPTNREV